MNSNPFYTAPEEENLCFCNTKPDGTVYLDNLKEEWVTREEYFNRMCMKKKNELSLIYNNPVYTFVIWTKYGGYYKKELSESEFLAIAKSEIPKSIHPRECFDIKASLKYLFGSELSEEDREETHGKPYPFKK